MKAYKENELPAVSICLCTFNRADFLERCLESVLSQSYSNIEIIVIDDASGIDVKHVVDKFNDPRVRFMRNDVNLGMAKNVENFIGFARGRYITTIGDDDIIEQSNVLEEAVRILDTDSKIVFVQIALRRKDDLGNLDEIVKLPEGIVSGEEFLELYSKTEGCKHGALYGLFRKDAVERTQAIGSLELRRQGIDDALGFDTFALIKLSYAGKVAFLNKPMVRRREHSKGMTISQCLNVPYGYLTYIDRAYSELPPDFQTSVAESVSQIVSWWTDIFLRYFYYERFSYPDLFAKSYETFLHSSETTPADYLIKLWHVFDIDWIKDEKKRYEFANVISANPDSVRRLLNVASELYYCKELDVKRYLLQLILLLTTVATGESYTPHFLEDIFRKLPESLLIEILRNFSSLSHGDKENNKTIEQISEIAIRDKTTIQMRDPKVCVFIPTYNRVSMLKRAIESIVVQDYGNISIIVLDDCSTDGSFEYVSSLKIPDLTIIQNRENIGGIYGDRPHYVKFLYELAQADYVIMLCDDDYIYDRGFISKAVAVLKNHENFSFVYGGVATQFPGLKRTPDANEPYIANRPLDGMPDAYFPKGLFPEFNTSAGFLTALAIDPKNRSNNFGGCLLRLDSVWASKALSSLSGSKWHTHVELYIRLALHGDVFYMDEPILLRLENQTGIGLSYARRDHLIDALTSIDRGFSVNSYNNLGRDFISKCKIAMKWNYIFDWWFREDAMSVLNSNISRHTGIKDDDYIDIALSHRVPVSHSILTALAVYKHVSENIKFPFNTFIVMLSQDLNTARTEIRSLFTTYHSNSGLLNDGDSLISESEKVQVDTLSR